MKIWSSNFWGLQDKWNAFFASPESSFASCFVSAVWGGLNCLHPNEQWLQCGARTRRFYLKFEPDLDGKHLSSIFHVLLFKVSLTFESGSELKSTAYNARSNFPLVLFFFFTILRNEIWDVSISKSGMAEMKELNCSNEPCWALLRWSIVGFFDFSPKWPLFWKSVVFVIC